MDTSDLIASMIKNPKQIGDKVFVYDGNDKLVHVYDTLDLGVSFFTMSNDIFFEMYGFNFVPRGIWWEKSKMLAGKM